MSILNFSTGVKNFIVNDAVEIKYNPTDPLFIERVYDVFLDLADKHEARKDKTFEDNKAFFEYARQRNQETCAAIDGLFGEVSAGLFGGVSADALAEGLPLWCNFLLSLMETFPAEMSQQVKKSKPRVEYYLKKYHK